MSYEAAVSSGHAVKQEATVMCAACGDEEALQDDRYCKWCGLLHEAMEERYARRNARAAATFAALPREDMGIVPTAGLRRHAFHWQIRDELRIFAVFVAFCLVGFYGQRFVCEIGIAIWDWWTR